MEREIRIPATLYRQCETTIRAADQPGSDGEPTPYPISFSSEKPVLRWSWDIGEYWEVLSHDPADIDLSRAEKGLPLLRFHMRTRPAGSVRDVVVAKKRLEGNAFFSSIADGQEAKSLVDEGHSDGVSVGYQVMRMDLIEKKKNGLPVYRCAWMPYEVSAEPIPADTGVGFGRSLQPSDATPVPAVHIRAEWPEDEPTNPEEGERERMEPNAPGGTPPNNAATPAPEPARAAAPSVGRDLASEARDLMEIAATNHDAMKDSRSAIDIARDWMQRQITPDQARAEVLSAIVKGRAAPASQPPSEGLDISKKDWQRYSVTRALNISIARKEGHSSLFNGLEASVDQELRRNRPEGASDHGGILLPLRKKRTDEEEALYRLMMSRALDSSTNAAALIETVFSPDLVDMLRNRAVVLLSGARFMTGLSGVLRMRKKTAAATVAWRGQNPVSAAVPSTPTYDYVDLVPQLLSGHVEIPRQLLGLQGSFDTEADVRNDLMTGHGLALDLGALHGAGHASNEPNGVWGASGVGTVEFNGPLNHDGAIEMTTKVAKANALMGTLAFLLEPALAGKAMATPIVAGNPLMLLTGNHLEGQMAGYISRSSNQLKDNLGDNANEKAGIFGNWNDLAVGIWGNELEVVVDPYTKAEYGQVVVHTFSLGDASPLRGESFCKALKATV